MRRMDEKEAAIAKALIRNPRQSDSEIARKSGIPVNTVNRKRKELEEEGIISYIAQVNQGPTGTGRFNVRHLYSLKLRLGLTPEEFTTKWDENKIDVQPYTEMVRMSFLGEIEGHLSAVYLFEGRDDDEIVRFFNYRLVPDLEKCLGKEVIQEVTTMRVSDFVQYLHNYFTNVNIEGGVIRKDWDEDRIYTE